MTIDKGVSVADGRAGASSPGDDRSASAEGRRRPASPVEFRLDPASGVPTYLQLVHQVEHALRLGYLKPGDQLRSLSGWLTDADGAGLDEDGVVALFTSALRDFYQGRSGPADRLAAADGRTENIA